MEERKENGESEAMKGKERNEKYEYKIEKDA